MSENERRIPEDIDRIASDIIRADYSDASEPEYAMYRAVAEAINAERDSRRSWFEKHAQTMSYTELAAHIAALTQILNEKRETASW